MFSAIAWWSGVTATALHLLVMVLLAVYGLHSLWLLGRFLRYRRQQTVPPPCLSDEPLVLVQLPVFNERDVVERVIAAVGALDWPRERLRIQLLDDSTDDSVDLGAAAIARLRDLGVDAVQVRRDQRDGFKAGALAHGLRLPNSLRSLMLTLSRLRIFSGALCQACSMIRLRPLFRHAGNTLIRGTRR
jgi:cellulose synthase/poly-beta-1,6-N-acetylglucosamine synthase-like glycosyltransferase